MHRTVFANPASLRNSAALSGPVVQASRSGSQTVAVLEPAVADEAQLVPANAKLLAILSLVFWAFSITAGRLMAYLGPQTGIK